MQEQNKRCHGDRRLNRCRPQDSIPDPLIVEPAASVWLNIVDDFAVALLDRPLGNQWNDCGCENRAYYCCAENGLHAPIVPAGRTVDDSDGHRP